MVGMLKFLYQEKINKYLYCIFCYLTYNYHKLVINIYIIK
jgi:hypothetical protein